MSYPDPPVFATGGYLDPQGAARALRAELDEAIQALGVLAARNGGEVAFTDADTLDIAGSAYEVLITRDVQYNRTVVKAVRHDR